MHSIDTVSVSDPIWPIFLQAGLGLIATLFATLVGVKTAFKKDREAQQKETEKRVLQHLIAIKNESSINQSVASNNFELIIKLQQEENGADSYALELFSTQAWNKAMNNQVSALIDPELHGELQEIYSQIESVNELTHRLRTEPLHSTIGEENDETPISRENWTIEVSFFNTDSQEVETSGLGDLIKNRCEDIKSAIDRISEPLSEEIADLEQNKQCVIEENRESKHTIWEKRNTN